jgi:hypothetical protein
MPIPPAAHRPSPHSTAPRASPHAARRTPRASLARATLALCLALAGCTTHYIPNTDVEDTKDNREVIAFCEKYRKAVEHRDVPLILSMASPKYYEDGGNVDASDDMDYEGLRQYMFNEFKKAKAIRYEIRYRRVLRSKETGRSYVDYTYSASYKVPGVDDKDLWHRTVSENRLELVRAGETFKIVAGM